MRTQRVDPHILDHLEWLGFVKPVGLVVSPPALVRSGAILNRRDREGQLKLQELIDESRSGADESVVPLIEFRSLSETVLGWSYSEKYYVGQQGSSVPEELTVVPFEGSPSFTPNYAVREPEPKEGGAEWQLLVHILDPGQDFDRISKSHGETSPHSAFEQALRKTGVAAGLIFNGKTLRLVSAPKGESSGWLDFQISDMASTAGRPISSAMRLLLGQERLLALPKGQRLPALLDSSRKFQNEVSERLAEQVLGSLYELLRGFQAANDASKGELLKEVLDDDPNQVYRALLSTLLRMVFLLYAEERDMLPQDETFLRSYSIGGLHERLREDAALNPDTMDQRYGAWAQLAVLFRMVYDGVEYAGGRLPKRHGNLFDPERYSFLEGRKQGVGFEDAPLLPLVSDGTIYRVLELLLVLDGERLSYRALDVEQIGSVYETIMGFRLETATGKSVAIKASKKHGAPNIIDLEKLLSIDASKRGKWVQDNTDRKLTDKVLKQVKASDGIEDLHAALHTVVAINATPDLVPQGAMILQPSDERRRSGSHYTPRSLTEPIVRTTLEPILKQLSESPIPEQILGLKICDPAMGSGAFLVEVCRQLGDELVKSWYVHHKVPTDIPPDEDELLYARRLIAQQCLYGVDKNEMAVDLAKLSLWLVTLARDHSFTFLDHSLRHGDSLVGLTREQITGFHWNPKPDRRIGEELIQDLIERATKARAEIMNAREDVSYHDQEQRLAVADKALDDVRLVGDACVSAFFAGAKKKEREDCCTKLFGIVSDWYGNRDDFDKRALVVEAAANLRTGEHRIPPFHWEIEFPEVFLQENGGFDVFVGNPPFLGGTRISNVYGMTYFQWLKENFPPAGHLCDLVAYFFRHCFDSLASRGAIGLVATNTISQGDTRNGGLTEICNSGGEIFCAKRRFVWPSDVSVVVSVVHIAKGIHVEPKILDGKTVPLISAYLFHAGGNDDPNRFSGRNEMFSAGSKIYGQGFLFADDDEDATPLCERERIIVLNPRAESRILPYMGGSELNSHPTQSPHRYVIFLSDLETENDLAPWPHLTEIVRRKVKPGRDLLGSNPNNTPLKRRWWAYQAHRPKLYEAMKDMSRVLIASQVTPHMAFAFQRTGTVFSQKLNVFLFEQVEAFGLLQCRVHEIWARFFSSTSLELLSYTPSDSFETFPFPKQWEHESQITACSQLYCDRRQDWMTKNNEGLTKTYNRFHDPYEDSSEIIKLRELHAAMDRAVLEAYGWDDLAATARCEFLLDYEEEDDENESGRKSRKKKPWRLRWPDDFRDEVLARLLELNEQRAKEEHIVATKSKGGKKKSKARKLKSESATDQGSFLETES